MSAPRLLAYLLSAVALATGLYLAAELGYLGFPDGHLTELDRVKAKLLPWCAAAILLSSGYFVYLGTRPPATRSARRVLYAALACLLLFVLAGVAYAAVTTGLDDGRGG